VDHINGRRVWQERIADFRKSGLSLRSWCKQTGFSRQRLRYWLIKYPVSGDAASTANLQWVPVNIDQVLATPVEALILTVRIGGAEIEIPSGFDPELVQSVLSALGSRPC